MLRESPSKVKMAWHAQGPQTQPYYPVSRYNTILDIQKRPAEWDASCSRARGELTGGCHISSAGIALLSHTFGCTCSRCPTGSSPRPHVQGWVSCSRTPQPDTTETHERATLSKATCAPKGLLPFWVSKSILKFPWNWNISGCACL